MLSGRYFLKFVSQEAMEFDREYSEFNTFFDGYQPKRRETFAFKNYLKDTGVVFSDTDFKDHIEFIKKEIKRQLTHIRWGMKAEGRVRIRQDAQVVKALSVFNRAAALLSSRAYHYKTGRILNADTTDSILKQVQ